MEHCGSFNGRLLVRVQIEGLCHQTSYVRSPQRMLEPGVMRPWKDQVGESELLDVAEFVQLRRAKEILCNAP
jgi:hypothetical protein